jgi:hypothetical protein
MVTSSSKSINIECLDSEAYNLTSVVANPRQVFPADLCQAVSNLNFLADESCPALALSFVKYIYQEYFPLCHQTGLYNRQQRVFESLARVIKVEVRKTTRGFLKKEELPCLELYFLGSRNEPYLGALIFEADFSAATTNEAALAQSYLTVLKDFLSKEIRLKGKYGNNPAIFNGTFFALAKPVPEIISSFLLKQTGGGGDPLSLSESLLPAPLSSHANLIGYEVSRESEDLLSQEFAFDLLLPKLRPIAKNLSKTELASKAELFYR